jgi:IgA Peptidase M64
MSTADGMVLGTTHIFGTALRDQAFNVVLLAEGFTQPQQNDFNVACAAFVTALTGTDPFGQVAHGLNVFRVNVASNESGADDPVAAGGTGATPSTYFDAQFGVNGLRRLLVCDESIALQVAMAQIPEFSIALVVVNSQIYGGSGGSVGVYSLAPGATEIALHEMGHSAFGLADEYAYYSGGVEPDHDHHPPLEPSEPNVTTSVARPTLKWSWAVDSTTALPTMSNPDCASVDSSPSPVPAGTVGLFEGAHYYHCGAYRPEYDCKMRALGVPFCRVCRQAIITRVAAPVVSTVPIGTIDTPSPQATVAGEVPFTGWAVDDSGIADVRIYRSPLAGEPTDATGLVFVGTAAMIDGARPDIVAAFPLYPGVSSAGWGFMILSNMLPNGGNGTFTMHAVARSQSGETQIIGTRVIVAANAASTQPFGTIDTPGQGAAVSGPVTNFGWALTPQPKTIPLDGSTIDVYIDGAMVGHPSYNHFRPDIAALFPGYANSNGAVGVYQFDSTSLTNGLHTISWVVRDDAGAVQGIGSRFFAVQN